MKIFLQTGFTLFARIAMMTDPTMVQHTMRHRASVEPMKAIVL
jgi:hypothetical protein